MACIYTESMYLNIGTDICASISAWRNSGSTNVHFDVTFSEDQKRGQSYYSWNTNAIKAAVDGYTGWTTVKAAGNASSGSASTSFTINTGNYDGGSKTFDIIFAVFNNAESGTVGGIPRFQVSVGWGSSASAPSQPTVSIAERYVSGAKFNVSISSYGSPDGADGRYIEAAILNQNTYGSTYKFQTASNTKSSAITVNNNTNKGTLQIKSNTRYWYGGYASNTVRSSSVVSGQFYTLPAIPVGSSYESTGTTTAQFNITDASEGSGQIIQLQYAIKENSAPESGWSAWIDAGATGNKQTRTVSLTGLSPGTSYDIMLRAKAGSSDYSGIDKRRNVFTTDEVGITIISRSSVYTSGDNCQTTLGYVITATGSATDTFDISYSYTDGQTTYGEYIINNASATGSFDIATKNNTPYTLTIKSRPTGQTAWGEVTTYQFTTPSFTPGAPTVTELKWRNQDGKRPRWGITANLTASQPGEGEAFNKMYYREEWYDEADDVWIQGGNVELSTTTASIATTTVRDPKLYPKQALVVWQTNDLGITSPVTRVVYQNQPMISGVIAEPGSKYVVVGVKTKTSDGVFHSGDFAHPFVIK